MEDLSAAIGIKLGYFAGWFLLCESAAQNASGRGASGQVKESARGLPGALLDLLQEPSGYNSSDTAAIDAQDPDDLVCHAQSSPSPQPSCVLIPDHLACKCEAGHTHCPQRTRA